MGKKKGNKSGKKEDGEQNQQKGNETKPEGKTTVADEEKSKNQPKQKAELPTNKSTDKSQQKEIEPQPSTSQVLSRQQPQQEITANPNQKKQNQPKKNKGQKGNLQQTQEGEINVPGANPELTLKELTLKEKNIWVDNPKPKQKGSEKNVWGSNPQASQSNEGNVWGQKQQPQNDYQKPKQPQQTQAPFNQQRNQEQKSQSGSEKNVWGTKPQQSQSNEGNVSGQMFVEMFVWGQKQQHKNDYQKPKQPQQTQAPLNQQRNQEQKSQSGSEKNVWGAKPQQYQSNEGNVWGQKPQHKNDYQKPKQPQQMQAPLNQQTNREVPKSQQKMEFDQKSNVSSDSSKGSSRPAQQSLSPLKYMRTDVNLARGTLGRKIKLEVNYLDLIIDKMINSAYHYDMKFDPERPKKLYRPAFHEYCRQVQLPPNVKLAFDGKCNVYSPVKLDNKYLKTVTLVARDDFGSKEFAVTLTETKDSLIDLQCLRENYRNLPIYDKPMRALQCLDIVLRSPCYGKGVYAGRAFYNPPRNRVDLTEGYELWYGLFQAAVLGERPLLNIDICHRSFPSGMRVFDLLNNLDRNPVNPNYQLDQRISKRLGDVIRGLNVIYTPPPALGQKKMFKVNRVLESADSLYFQNEQKQRITVAQYFTSRGIQLRFPKMPCIHVGNPQKTIFIPIEFLELEAGQVNLKKAGPQQVRRMIREAATTTSVRKEKTLNEFRRFNHNMDPTLEAFQIKVAKDFIELEGRVIDAPTLSYANGPCHVREGAWDPTRSRLTFLEKTSALQCTFLIMDRFVNENEAKRFGDSLKRGGVVGVQLEFGRSFRAEFRERDTREIENLFQQFQNNVNLVFVILSGREKSSYSKVKQLAELRYGLLTQCLTPDTVNNKNNPSTIHNILLKVNAKLNGSTHKLDQKNETNILKQKDVMFIGADVTHPSPDQRSIPSVVGVAASHDANGVKYNIQWRLQDPKKEIISNMDSILEAHLKIYEKNNKALPKKIVYYRDGVSDGQFPHIKEFELKAMDQACAKFRDNGSMYRPKITCVIVQKRHRTRFFPKARQDQTGKFENVPPGTIVDTVITHPNECQFFMVSHRSIQGTARPTKYVIIRDDSKFNIDDIQALTNNLCHVFTRCNSAVSYPAPAYYAHLVAYRGRVYIENVDINLRILDKEYEKRKIINLDKSNPMFFV